MNATLALMGSAPSEQGAVVHHGRLDVGVHLLAKPYRRQDLAAKVRSVPDERD